jgi:ribosome-binding protein aMBF1 (putative translation factor)
VSRGRNGRDARAAQRAAALADGQRIRQKRQLLGWTRRELAAECGVSQADILACERGRLRVGAAVKAQIEACLDAKRAELDR